MPTLQVRDLPEEIYEALKRAARAEHRSLTQQAIIALAKGLRLDIDHRDRRNKLLSEWEQSPLHTPKDIDVTSWVRTDRDTR